MTSPLCEVKEGAGAYGPTSAGVDATPASTITIHLIDTAGVSQWSISCISTDETSDAATVTSSLTIDSVAKTATFTAPAAGKAYRFRSTVNNGMNANNVADASYSNEFVIHTLTAASLRVAAAGETTETGTAGWVAKLNAKIREAAGGGGGGSTPTGTGFRHVTAGTEDAASAKVDLTASADVTVPSAGVVTSNGTVLASVTAPSGTIVGTTDSQALTNKTISGASNTITNVSLTAGVTGTLPVANGGTNLTAVGTALQVLRTNAGATALEWATPSSGGSSAGSSGAVQVSDGASGFSDPGNVVAGSGYVSIGTNPNTTAGSLRFGDVEAAALISGRTKWSGSFADAPIVDMVNGYTMRVGSTTQWDMQLYAGSLSLWGALGFYMYTQSGAAGLYITNAALAAGVPIIGNSGPYSAHGGVKHTFASDANYTVTAAQYIYDYLKFSTGSWTANHTVTFPHPATFAAGYYKTVANNTTYVITVSTGTGTTVTLASGYAQRFFFSSDGVNAGAAAVIL